MNLNNPKERIKLLKSGLSESDIERLYISSNDLKIVNTSEEISKWSNLITLTSLN